mmetsp:Transcript_37566/g.94831  ORF Transcript_37566/g.94831 Transcript_37566/m.94831 type:complete len:312 (-) Transcript_37566:713-1648(-)
MCVGNNMGDVSKCHLSSSTAPPCQGGPQQHPAHWSTALLLLGGLRGRGGSRGGAVSRGRRRGRCGLGGGGRRGVAAAALSTGAGGVAALRSRDENHAQHNGGAHVGQGPRLLGSAGRLSSCRGSGHGGSGHGGHGGGRWLGGLSHHLGLGRLHRLGRLRLGRSGRRRLGHWRRRRGGRLHHLGLGCLHHLGRGRLGLHGWRGSHGGGLVLGGQRQRGLQSLLLAQLLRRLGGGRGGGVGSHQDDGARGQRQANHAAQAHVRLVDGRQGGRGRGGRAACGLGQGRGRGLLGDDLGGASRLGSCHLGGGAHLG